MKINEKIPDFFKQLENHDCSSTKDDKKTEITCKVALKALQANVAPGWTKDVWTKGLWW
jgi:hypothetical protein